MMRIKENLFYRLAVLGAVIPLLLFSCAKKKDSQVIIIGSESLTVEQLVKLDPVAPSDSVRIKNIKLRKAIASETDDSGVDSLAIRFSEQIQLRAGEEWTPRGAGLLLSSGRVLYRKLNELSSSNSVAAYAESLFMQYNKGDSTGPGLTAVFPDSVKLEKQEEIERFFSGIFGISETAGQLLFEFVKDQQDVMSSEDAERIIKGLVYTGEKTDTVKETRKPLVQKKVVDNSLTALKYRGQQSIRDSIEKHIPNLKSIYKKRLKIKEYMSGTVMITFLVDASGKVIDAKISKSSVNDKEFSDLLSAYVMNIRFKPVPEEVGNMSFEFPFEFNPE